MSLFELENSNKIRTLRNLFNDRNKGVRISRPEADGILFLCVMGMKNVSIGHLKNKRPHSVPRFSSVCVYCPLDAKAKSLTYNFS